MRIAIIPARGGSKRIPRKNIKEFCGKPMIAWSIETALKSGCFDKVIVSTDCEEIAATAKASGAEVPFTRPESLSDDYTGTMEVVEHAWKACEKHYEVSIELVCCLYATAPLLQAHFLREGLDLIKKDEFTQAVFSATSFPFPIQRALLVNEDSEVAMFQPEHMATRSQDLEEAYHDAGQFYWMRKKALSGESPLFSSESKVILLPRKYTQDIDTPEDWEEAEIKAKILLNQTR